MAIVSVIVPVYNGAKYIRQAIDSLLAQGYQDWELLVTDDGSTDETPQILAQYSDPRIHVFRQANAGEAAARNAALRAAAGEFITFLDADDLYLPDFLESMVRYMEQNPSYGVVFSDGYMIDAEGNRLGRLTEFRPGLYTGNILEPLVLDNGILTVPVCTIVRRSAIQKSSALFDRTLGYGTDWDFWIQLACHVQFGYYDRPVCAYRVHETNMTRVGTSRTRKNDLARGRMKVIKSAWFSQLSLPVQEQVVYQLVINLLESQPDRQLEALNLPEITRFSKEFRALLYRLIGTEILRSSNDIARARACFEQAIRLNPKDIKAVTSLWLVRLGSGPVIIALTIWRPIYQQFKQLKAIGKRKARPIPEQLRPAGE